MLCTGISGKQTELSSSDSFAHASSITVI